jgi:hypothetical protein
MRLILIRNYSNLLKFLLLTLLFQSCNKADQVFLEEKEFTSMERKFFFTNRTGDLTESKLVDFFMRQNRSKRFVEKTIKIIGFPKWEKMITIKSKSGINGRGASDSLLTTYLIPFVRDSQNYVNASLIISVYPSDTTYTYRSDWQYRNRAHGSPTVDSTAEAHALFFMFLDNRTFSYTEFNITDTSLFPTTHVANGGIKKLKILNTGISPSGRSNSEVTSVTCFDFTVCQSTSTETRTSSMLAPTCNTYTYCYTNWSTGDNGSTTSGTGGGSSGGSGGTGNPGDGSPSPCPGTTTYQRGQTATYGCGPGWNGIITPTDPCLSAQPAINIVSALTQSNSFLQAISNIHGADPNLEHSVTFGKDANGNIAASPMSTGGPNNGTVNTNWPGAYADVHNHPSNKEPSEGDLYGIIGLSVSNVGWNTRMVSNKNDEMYALAVLDTAAAKIFRNNSFIINPTYGPILKDEIMTEYQNVSLYFQQQQYSKLYSDERALAYILDKYNTGVVLLKREGTTFKRLRTSAGSQNDTYLSNDCN